MDQSAQDPSLEARVGRLEVDMHDVKSTLGRLEPMIVSIHAQMPYLATKAEMEQLRGELSGKIEGYRADLETKMAGYRADLETKMAGLRADLEAKIENVRGTLEAKIEGIRGDLELKIEGLRGEVRAGLAEKPGFVGMWVMGATLFGLAVAAFTAGAAYLPVIAQALHTAP
jgi:hypothetical protein